MCCHFLFVGEGVDPPSTISLFCPIWLQLIWTSIHPATHTHTHTYREIYKQRYQYYTVKVWDQARLCCTCALHPHERVAHLEELGADFELRRLAAGLLGTLPAVLDSLKQLVNSPRDDALLLLAQVHIEARPHGVGLPRTRLKHSSWVLFTSYTQTSHIYVQQPVIACMI